MAKAAVSNNNGTIAIKFMLNGHLYKMGKLGKVDDSQAKALAERICLSINADLASATFDCTDNTELYNRYHPSARLAETTKAKQVSNEGKSKLKTPIDECFELWVKQYEDKNSYASIRGCLSLEGIAPSTYNTRLMYAQNFGRWLVAEGYRVKSPYEALERKKLTNLDKVQNRDPFTVDEVRLILEAFKLNQFGKTRKGSGNHSELYAFVLFLFKTGVRTSEAIGLQVKHIDFRPGVITIESSLSRNTSVSGGKGERVRKSTKTNESRFLKMSKDLSEVLKQACEGKQSDDLVFIYKGQIIDDRSFLHNAWMPVLNGLNITYRPPYTTRHTTASHYINNTKDIFGAAKILGHKDTKQIMSTYGHLLELPDLPSY